MSGLRQPALSPGASQHGSALGAVPAMLTAYQYKPGRSTSMQPLWHWPPALSQLPAFLCGVGVFVPSLSCGRIPGGCTSTLTGTRGPGEGLKAEEGTLWPQAGDSRWTLLHEVIKPKQPFTLTPMSQLINTPAAFLGGGLFKPPLAPR